MEIIVDAYNESGVWTGWYCYLENALAFPFEAECVKSRKMSPLKTGERVTVLGMLDDDEGDGLGEMMVEAKWRDCTMGIPLAQIKGIGVDEKPSKPLPIGTIGWRRDGSSDGFEDSKSKTQQLADRVRIRMRRSNSTHPRIG